MKDHGSNRPSRIGTFFRKNGFYVALCVCVAGAALLSYAAVSSLLGRTLGRGGSLSEQQPAAPDTAVVEYGEPAGETAVPQKELPVQQPAAEPQTDDQPAAPAAADDSLFEPIYCAPVEGAVLAAFSNYELVQDATMKDWRTHNGIDIAAPDGTPVAAVYAGVVTRAERDGLWGNTVTLRLDTNYEVVYANLASFAVTEGQRVSQGEILGAVGSSAALESALEPHLHFEVKSGISYLDPSTLLG